MPNFNLVEIKALSRRTMYGWDQNDIDLAIAYLSSRSWRPCKTTLAKGAIVPELNVQQRYQMPYEQAHARNNIADARFSEPGSPGSCGAQKALVRALKLQRGNHSLKAMVADAKDALNKGNKERCQELLEKIHVSVGG